MSNFGLAPRLANCWVCKNVGPVEDVTLRLLDEAGAPQPYGDAIKYLRAIGHSADSRRFGVRLKSHRDHVLAAMKKPIPITPAAIESGKITRIEAPAGNSAWLRTTDRAIDIGAEAIETLATRLDSLDTNELAALARLGVSAAAKRGDWEARGRQLGQMDALLQLVAGFGDRNGG